MSELTMILITYAVIAVIWYVIQTIGCLGVFKKTESKKSLAFIPLLREKELFDISVENQKAGVTWLVLAVVGLAGFLAGSFTKIQILAWIGFVAIILAVILAIYRNYREAKSFGRGAGTAVILTLFDPLGNLIIGRSFSEYKGRN